MRITINKKNNENIFVLVKNKGNVEIKAYKDLQEKDVIFEETKDLPKEEKEAIISNLPELDENHDYVIITGFIIPKKKYPKNRKKRDPATYLKNRGKVIDSEIKEEKSYYTVGEKLKLLRLQKGYSINELARITGVHYLTIGQLENSVVFSKFETFEKVCLGLNLSFEKMQSLYSELQLEFIHKRRRK